MQNKRLRCSVSRSRIRLVASVVASSLILAPGFDSSRLLAEDCDSNGIDDFVETEPDRDGLARELGLIVSPLPEAVIIADMDRDGLLDIATANSAGQNVSFIGHRGEHLWEVDNHYGTGGHSLSIAAADFNGDGNIDLATANGLANTISVLFNGGPGWFAPPQIWQGGGVDVRDIVAGDLDGDGDSDIAALHRGSNSVALLFNSEGDFGESSLLQLDGRPYALALGDIDGDSDPDLLLAAGGSAGDDVLLTSQLRVFLNDGAGSFEALPPIAEFGQEVSFHFANIDADGHPDLVVTDGGPLDGSSQLRVFWGDGRGGFQEQSIGTEPDGAYRDAAMADFDGDGDGDLVVSMNNEAVLRLFTRTGNRSFVRGISVKLSSAPMAIAIADFDGDGRDDVVTTESENERAGTISILYGGLTSAVPDCNGNRRPDSCDIADRTSQDGDRNGIPDECDDDCNGDGIGDGVGTFRGFAADCNRNGIPDECEIAASAIADCNGDGIPDACEVDCNGNGVSDVCDIGSGLSADANDNGVVDECENELGFFASLEFEDSTYQASSIGDGAPFEVLLHTFGLAPGEPGVQGWSVGVEMRGCTSWGATTAGTAGASITADPPGLRDGGFEKTDIFHSAPHENVVSGVVSAVVLSFATPVTLDPGDSPHVILRATARGFIPESGGCSPCRFHVTDSPLGYAQGIRSIVTYQGAVNPIRSNPELIEICFNRFRRGDVNDDGRVDISDGISVFGYLFLGETGPPCLEAADINDDGEVNISDGIFVLSFLFGSGRAPPPPYSECGVDAAESSGHLACAFYQSCEP